MTGANHATRPKALILGASGGLGRAYAEALACDGFDLILSGRDSAKLDAVEAWIINRVDVGVSKVVADLCNPDDRARISSLLLAEPNLTWLVNASGIAQWREFITTPINAERALFELNLLAPIDLIRAAYNAFLGRSNATIVQIASGASFYSVPYLAAYCASKGAIVQFITAFREEVRDRGVSIQALCPGFVKTEMFTHAGANAERLPSWIWMSPERVVRESIRSAKRNRAICIPGLRYRLVLFASKWVPMSYSRRVAGWMFGRFEKYQLEARSHS
jgi:short-subunit dehydrogenase